MANSRSRSSTAAIKKKKYRSKMTKQQKQILTIVVVTGFMLCLAMGLYLYFEVIMKSQPFLNENNGITGQFESYEPKQDQSTVGNYAASNEDLIKQNQMNVLMVGYDENRSNTDVIIVASIDKAKGTLSMLQIPRDTFVDVGTTGKINGVSAVGDKNLSPINRLIKVINQDFKLPIDYYMTVDLEGFKDIVDEIGGIPIDIPQRIEYDAASVLEKGPTVLNGRQAEWFVRYRRGYTEGDIGRAKMQRVFLAAAMQHCKNLGTTKIIGVLDELLQYCESDMTIAEIKEFIAWGMNIEMEDMRIFMVPGEAASYKSSFDGRNYSVWSVHLESTAKMLNEYFRPYQKDVSSIDLPLIELANTIDVYEDTDDSFSELISGVRPGGKNDED